MDQMYIDNAGLVLLWPYFPRLFSSLNLVENKTFVDGASAKHAALLLQYIVNSETDSPEYQLPLNKVLCGIQLEIPIQRTIEVTTEEEELVESMLQAVIEHWSALGSSSIEGLQKSFLERSGRLTQQDSGWELTVEPRTFDMLLDRLPWAYQAIKLPWMSKLIHVNWR